MKKLILPGVFSLSILSTFTPAFAQAGHLDPSFGSNGTVQTSFGSGNTFSVSGAALAPNGDIVVSGTVTTVSTSLDSSVIVRYLPSGALDPTFGKGGILTLPSPDAESLAFGVAGGWKDPRNLRCVQHHRRLAGDLAPSQSKRPA